MYTQYRPSPTSTNNSTQQKPIYFANRESLFYHSTDNHRMTYTQRQQQFILEQQKQLREQQKKFLEQQQKLCDLQEDEHQSRVLAKNSPRKVEDLYSNKNVKPKTAQLNWGSNSATKVAFIKHSTPFNVTNQVRSISDIFQEDLSKQKSEQKFQFDRLDINQLSTKSQPPIPTQAYQREYLVNTANRNLEQTASASTSTSSTMSSSSASSSTSSSLSDRQLQHFYNQQLISNNNNNNKKNIMLPHPAQV